MRIRLFRHLSCAAALVIFGGLWARAQLSAIHRQSLPQEPAVLGALDDLEKLEPYSSTWSPEWKYDIAKDTVATGLSKDLGILQLAEKQHPDNVELSLLVGLAARYAYNLDVDGTYTAATVAFGHAAELNPSDIRAPWFRGAFICSTGSPGPGAEELLAMEAAHSWEALPAGFWEDYMFCMHVVSMPMHVLRAAKHLEDLHVPESPMGSFLVGVEKKRFEPVDKDKVYGENETWGSEPIGSDVLFANTGCGIGIELQPGWKATSLRLAKGDCKAELDVGAYGKDKAAGSVLLFAEWQRPNETLHDFLLKYGMKGYEPRPLTTVVCPIPGCQTLQIVPAPEKSKTNTRQNYMVLFERNEPEFPGLALEVPNPPRGSGDAPGATYFHPDQLKERVPGKIYYSVIFAVDKSYEPEALKDFEFLLEKLRVD